MAQKIQTLFIDDLDGSEAEGTVRFGLDGAAYEIDLNAKHAEVLRDALSKYVDAARRITASRKVPGIRRANDGARITSQGVNGTEQREYLRLLGHTLSSRGRIPAHLVAIPVPPRDQWPNGESLTVAERGQLAEHVAILPADPPMPSRVEVETAAAEAVLKSPAAVASEATDAILAEPPAVKATEPVEAKAEPEPTRGAGGYDQAFRDRAVRMTLAEGASLAAVARELGVSEGSLRNWRKTYQAAEAAAATSGASTPAKSAAKSRKK